MGNGCIAAPGSSPQVPNSLNLDLNPGAQQVRKLQYCASLLFLTFLLHYQLTLAQTSVDPAPLFNAAGGGDVVAIKKALNQGISVNAKDKDGVTAIMLAASEGKLAAVQALVKAGADVNAATKDGLTPLMSAAFSGSAAIVKLLLAEGANKAANTAKGLTAADIAVQAKKPDIVKLLASSGNKAPTKTGSPKQIDAKEAAAAEAYQKGRYDEAARLFKELTSLDPKHALGWHFLGQSLEKSGQKEDAAEAFQKSLEIQPTGEVADRNKLALTEIKGRWSKDANGCKLSNQNPQPNETVTWTGSCNQGYAEGEGVVKWTVGEKSSTEQVRLVRGKRQGRCVSTHNDGAESEGNCVNDVRIGPGRFKYKDGAIWEGTYTNGSRTGRGKLTYAGGNTYEGDFVNGKLQGKGKLVWNSNTYEGNFNNNKLEGPGVRTTSGGTRFEGAWSNGTENGFFNVTYVDGSWFKGEYRNGLPNGPGTAFIAASGRTYTGNFVNGCYGDPSDMYNRVAMGVQTEKCGW